MRPATVVGAVVGVAILIVAVVDFQRTSERVPPVPALCQPDTTECENARNEELFARLDEIHRLERDYRRRAWIYALLAAAAVTGTAAAALRGRDAAKRRRVFQNLGVAGVCLGLGAAALLY